MPPKQSLYHTENAYNLEIVLNSDFGKLVNYKLTVLIVKLCKEFYNAVLLPIRTHF